MSARAAARSASNGCARIRPAVRSRSKSDPERQRFIEHNRDALGVPGLQLVAGRAPDALEGLPAPDAIFIGGGVTVPGVLEACWACLREGGRLVANAVTLQGEAVLVAWREQYGGTLTRIALARGSAAWRLRYVAAGVADHAAGGEQASQRCDAHASRRSRCS